MIKLRVVGWGDSAGLPRWSNRHHKGPGRREAGALESDVDVGGGERLEDGGGAANSGNWKRQETTLPRGF